MYPGISISSKTFVLVVQKNLLIEMVLLSTQNICLRKKKNIILMCLRMHHHSQRIITRYNHEFEMLTLFILMDYPIHIDTTRLSMGLSIFLYFKGLSVKISIK